jgi:hypothetical protein
LSNFELYNYNDEVFNIYYGIFYELWICADFDRLCKLEKRRDEIKKKSSPLKLLSKKTLLKWSLGGPLSQLCPSAPSCIQDGAITKSRNFFKRPKLLYFKPWIGKIWTV